MTWNDILLDRAVRADEVFDAVAYMFGVGATVVRVTDDPARIEPAQVTCLLRRVDGDFVTVLEVYVHDPTLMDRPLVPTLARLGERLGCSCLVADGSANPYSWVLVDGAGHHRSVLLDAHELDERDRYVLRR